MGNSPIPVCRYALPCIFHLRRIKHYFLLTFICFFALSLLVSSQQSHPFLAAQVQDQESASSNTVSRDDEPKWVTIQSVEVPQPAATGMSRNALPPVKLNIDQVRNGTGAAPKNPVEWQNGNAGGSNAHYVEGWSIPYRIVITNLTAGGTQFVDIEWDIRHSGKNAIDFITHYDMIDFPLGSHALNFNHPQEAITPLAGFETANLTYVSPDDDNKIPMPDLPFPQSGTASETFAAIANANKGFIEIWNGEITDLEYITQGSLAANSSSTKLRIHFTNLGETVIIAWGGHIAKATDWGAGNSASAVSGSPYHTRLIAWDPDGDGVDLVSIGNQDRSLSADAVIDAPPCDVDGALSVCPSSSAQVYQNLAATDPNVIPSGFKYVWSVTGNGTISGSTTGAKVTVLPGSTCNATYTVKLTITTTNDLFVTSCEEVVAVADTQAPTLTCPGAITVACASNVPAANTALVTGVTDNCGGTVTVTHVGDNVSNQTCANRYTITRTYKATDACGNSATCTQTIIVNDQTAPSLTCPANVTVSCASEVPAVNIDDVTGESDNCSGTVSVTFVSDVISNQTCANRYRITRTYRATDVCGNSATCTQIIVVNDQTPPQLTCPGPVTVSCASAVPAADPNTVTGVSDNCAGTVSVTFVGDQISNQSCPNRYTITRTYRATDVCGNSATCTQTIIVNDNSAPSLTCPDNITVACASQVPNPNTGSVTGVSDNCSGTVTVTHVGDVTSNQTCANRFTITRTYKATDACGNSATCTQLIIINDQVPPQLTCPGPVTVSCASAVPAPNVGSVTGVSDNCAGTVSVTWVGDATSGQTCANRYTITRTYKATDVCGNSATCTQTIIVNDQTAPVLTCPSDKIVECSASTAPTALGAGVATATDNCGTVSVTYEDANSSNGCQSTITRTWTAVDLCGNSSTCTQIIIIRDRTAPQIFCNPNGTATATDNCSDPEDITLILNNGVWTAIDESGNISTCNQAQGRTVVARNTELTNTAVSETKPTVMAFPNPFREQVRFVINTPKAVTGSLDIFNLMGQKIKSVYQGMIPAGTRTFDLNLPGQQFSTLIYVFRTGEEQISGKLLQIADTRNNEP